MAEIIQINENTWRIEDGFVRFFLLEGEEQAMLIDSGVNCPNALELVKSLTDKPVMLLNTHGDGDHTSGTAAFEEIHMHASDYKNCNMATKYPQTKLIEIMDGQVIDLGNRKLKMIHIPGHTAGSLAILDCKNRALFAGDSVQMGHIFMFGPNREPDKYEASLDKLIGLVNEYDVIYASHDEYKLAANYASLVKEAWKKVRNEEASYEMIDLFGNKVKSYTLECCGFYLF